MLMLRGRTRTLIAALAGLVASGATLCVFAQSGDMTAVATADPPTRNPACMNEQVSVTLSATVYNPPSSYCTLTGPVWSWVVKSVERKPVQYASWAAADPGFYWGSLNQPDLSSPGATLAGSFSVGGYYRLTIEATVIYSDTCGNKWTASGTVQVMVTVIGVDFTISPVALPRNDQTGLGASVTPADANTSLITFAIDDTSTATVSVTGMNLNVSGISPGNTSLRAFWMGRICAVDNVTVYDPLVVCVKYPY